MINNEQALSILKRIQHNKPNQFFNKINDAETGMRCVLVFINENKGDVYANTIAEKMQISRARIAVLIRKLVYKGFIKKVSSNKDARIDVLKITSKGLDELNSLKESAIANIKKVVSVLGVKEVYHFLDISEKIKKILKEV